MASPTGPAVLCFRDRRPGEPGPIEVLRGDLVSQGREKPIEWSQASFDGNEGEGARYQVQLTDRVEEATRSSHPRACRGSTAGGRGTAANCRGAGAADGDVRGAWRYLEFARRARAGVSDHAAEFSQNLRGQVWSNVSDRGRTSFARWQISMSRQPLLSSTNSAALFNRQPGAAWNVSSAPNRSSISPIALPSIPQIRWSDWACAQFPNHFLPEPIGMIAADFLGGPTGTGLDMPYSAQLG